MNKRIDILTRASVFALLSDAEVARVSTAETATRLPTGDEYLDLEHLERGVCRADGTALSLHNVLPRNAILDATWSKILAQLVTPVVAA